MITDPVIFEADLAVLHASELLHEAEHEKVNGAVIDNIKRAISILRSVKNAIKERRA